MSTSDAAELKLRAAGGETATPPCGAPQSTSSPAAKKQQDETFRHFRPQSYLGYPSPAEQAHSALTSGTDELHLRALSNVNIHSSAGSSFTSCLFFKLSKPEGSDQSDQHPSLIKQQLVGTRSSSTFPVKGRPSSAVSIETTNIFSSSETIPLPSKREEKLFPAVNHEVEATNWTHVLSNGDCRPHEQNENLPPRGLQQRSFSPSVTGINREKLLKDRTNPAGPQTRSDPPGAMLSSTVVTVLAPHWSGRMRRHKRFDGSGNSETQEAVKHDHGFQHGVESAPRRVPVLGTRRNTVGWSAKSDPSSLDFESKRKLTQTVSLDPSATHVGSFFLDPNNQRRNPQTGHQGGFSPLSSNPPTSSLLLSFRRFGSNNRNCNSTTDTTEGSLSPLSSDRIGKPFSNNNHERPKPLLSPSYRTSEPGLVVSPTSPNHRDSLFFSASPENSPYTRQPQSSLTSSKHTDKNTNLSSDIPSPRHSQYDPSPAVKTHPLPRRTTLTSTSWWKKVSQEGNDGIKDESKTIVAPPFNRNNDTAFLSLPDNKRPSGQIPSNSDNNNMAEPLCRGNVNLALRTEADRFGKEKYGTNLNREAQRPRSFLDSLSVCRGKHDVSNASFTAKIFEPPTDSSRYKSTDCPPKTSGSHTFTPNMDSHKFSSLSVDSTSVLSRQTAHHATSGLSHSPNSSCSFSFHSRPQTSSSQTSRFPSKSNVTPIGFERNYVCVPKPFQPKSPGVDSLSRTNSSPVSASHARVPSSLSITSLSVTPPRTSPTSLLTPPATPVITAPSSDASSPKGGRLSCCSPGSEAKKAANGSEGKKARRVTWEDSVDVRRSEPDRLPQSIPSIFSFLRSGSSGRTSNMQAGKGGKFRSLSSDSAEKAKPRPDGLTFEQGGRDGNSFRTLSVESATAPAAAALSLPPDFSNRYTLRYSSPPYSTLVSSRQTPDRFPAFSQSSQPDYSPQLSPNTPVRPPLPLPLPFIPTAGTQGSAKCSPSDADRVNNNYSKHLDSQIQLLDNRVRISSQSLPGDSFHSSSSTYVTETLVYSIKPKADAETKKARPKPLQHGANTAVCVENEFNGPQRNGGTKESALGKSRFYSVDVNNEQSSKRSRFALKKSLSTPSSAIGSDSDRVSKSYNRMDQVFHKLRQKFSSRRSEEDAAFPWKWKRSGQAPSLSGSSDISSVSDKSADSTKTLEEAGVDPSGGVETGAPGAPMQSRYVPAAADTKTVYQLSVWSEKPAQETEQSEHHKESVADGDQFDQLLDPSPGPTHPSQSRKSTPSPRSPFSPFSSLSPLSPFTPPDMTDDSVFFSPKLQRRRESSSPCEPRDGLSLGGCRRSRASTGPPSAAPGTDREQLASSYANLKYGIEPGRSFSVSSVLSSRPSGPGRISTGSRFMSVGDLSQSALSCRDSGRDLEQSPATPDWTGEFGFQPRNNCGFPTDPSKMRSRSLPRSLTRCLTNWGSGVSPLQPSTSSKPARRRSPTNFAWDAEGPLTPPLTPPLSPVSRRMSKPPSLSSPTFPSSSGALQQADSRGRLHSRDYVSSLGTFDESSDSSSDTTTDDEYYLEADGEGEKETEL